MQNLSQECGICREKYDREEHIPVSLPQCRHTICNACAQIIMKNPHATCPFDQIFFPRAARIGTYRQPQINGYALDNIENKQDPSNRCQKHGMKLKYYCRTECEAICSDCLIDGHKGLEHDTCSLNDIVKKVIEKQKELESCKTALQKHKAELTGMLEKRKFQQIEDIDKFYNEIDEIVKRQRQENKSRVFWCHMEEEQRLEQFFKKDSKLVNCLEEKNKQYQNIKFPTRQQIYDEDYKNVISQFEKNKFQQTCSEFKKELDQSAAQFQQSLKACLSQFQPIDLAGFRLDNASFNQESSELYGSLNLAFDKQCFKISSCFAINMQGNDSANITINKNSNQECLIFPDRLHNVKNIKITLQSIDLRKEEFTSLEYIFKSFVGVQSLALRCDNSVSDNSLLTSEFDGILGRILSIIFQESQRITCIDIIWLKKEGGNRILEYLSNHLFSRKLNLSHLNVQIKKSNIQREAFAKFLTKLRRFENQIKALTLNIDELEHTISSFNIEPFSMANLKRLNFALIHKAGEKPLRYHESDSWLNLLTHARRLEELNVLFYLSSRNFEENLLNILFEIQKFKKLQKLDMNVIISTRGSHILENDNVDRLRGVVAKSMLTIGSLETFHLTLNNEAICQFNNHDEIIDYCHNREILFEDQNE